MLLTAQLRTRNLLKQAYYCAKRLVSSAAPLRPKKNKSQTNRRLVFVDWRKISATGGIGGDGACTFLQIWCNPEAGPDGGDGGNGGHVIFEASTAISSLGHIPSVCTGQPGEKGYSQDCHGKCAEHRRIQVPIGTVFKDESGKIVADLDKEGRFFIAARGGAGGKGNHFFLSNETRAPVVSEIGAEGEKKIYSVELKVIAHVGLIGFPNAGKSTLLRAISRARPKVASYPFTTLNPHIGVVHFEDHEQLFVADIPGLVPGAHLNQGLGISFLRHIERCICLLFVIDLSVEEPWNQLDVLRHELDQYQPQLSQRPQAIVGNKVDLPNAQENARLLQEHSDLPIISISAKRGNNVMLLLEHLRQIYDENVKLRREAS